VGGGGFQAGKSEPAIPGYVADPSTRAGDAVTVLSAPPQPWLWSRLLGRLRRG
jgi:hypothetical protein